MKVRVVEGAGGRHGPDCKCMICPFCGATEVDDCRKPHDQWVWQIRPFRVDDASHCLKCDQWFTLADIGRKPA